MTAVRDPRYSAPDIACGLPGTGEDSRIRCIGVHIACMTSGGRVSKRIMVSEVRDGGRGAGEVDGRPGASRTTWRSLYREV